VVIGKYVPSKVALETASFVLAALALTSASFLALIKAALFSGSAIATAGAVFVFSVNPSTSPSRYAAICATSAASVSGSNARTGSAGTEPISTAEAMMPVCGVALD
jgi:hypothetical protein